MRSDTPLERVAGISATGTLTSPKVIVPDQNERAPTRSSSDSVRSGTLPPLACGGEAAFEYVGERLLLRAGRGLRELHDLSGCLRLHQVQHAVAVLVPVGGDVEVVLHRGDELLRHAKLAFVQV